MVSDDGGIMWEVCPTSPVTCSNSRVASRSNKAQAAAKAAVPSPAFGKRAPKLVGSPRSAGAAAGHRVWKHRTAGHL